MGDDDFFREFEHTGDAGIEVEGSSRTELFAHAIVAMARIMVDREGIRALERREIEARADNDGDRMHDLLAAALNAFLIDGFIWCDATVAERDGTLVATLTGERFDSHRHQFLTELKAVTYHRLAVEQLPGRWLATIVFDV
ncbi:MAG: archease [Candidatus Binataceae bacterium]